MKKKLFKQVSAGLLAMALIAGILPTGLRPLTVHAANGVKTVNLDTSYLAPSDGSWDAANDHNVWFGQYGGTPTAFRVLKADGTTMMLDCDTILLMKMFDEDNTANMEQNSGNMNEWTGSDLEKWLNGTDYYENTSVFTSREQSVIQQTSFPASEADYDINDMLYKDYAANDSIYLLSAKEANDLYADNAARVKTGGNAAWWLRSAPAYGDDGAGIVDSPGKIVCVTSVFHSYPGVSPALNIDITKVLFTSVSGVDKSSSFALTTDATDNKNWNLTLAGGTDFAATLTGTSVEQKGEVDVFVNSMGTPGTDVTYTQISAMLVDANNNVLAYGKIGDAAAGTVTFNLPDNIGAGNYTLKVFAEDVRSSKSSNLTDYASNMVEFGIMVEETQPVASVYAPNTGDAVNYSSISDAIAALADDGTLTLLADVSLGSVWTVDKNVTLDLAGHELNLDNSYIISVASGTTLTIMDSGNDGSIIGGTYGYIDIENGGGVTVNGGSITGDNYGIANFGTLTINGGTITSSNYAIYSIGDLIISGGNVKGGVSAIGGNGTIAISGGVFSHKDDNWLTTGYGWLTNTEESTKDSYPYRVAEVVTITYKPNYDGEETDQTQSIEKNVATELTANSFTRDGYTFIGWAMNETGTTVYTDEESVTLNEDTNLYAVWSADGFTVGNLTYTINKWTKNTVSVKASSTSISGAVTIPATVTYDGVTYAVKNVENYGFKDCTSLTSVTIPEGVEDIGTGAFMASGLTTVTIPNSIAPYGIGKLAFRDTPVISVIISCDFDRAYFVATDITVGSGNTFTNKAGATGTFNLVHSYGTDGNCENCDAHLMDECAFLVTGTYGVDYTYADGVLTIIGSTVEIANKKPEQSTTDRILIGDGAETIILNGVNIDTSFDPAIRIDCTGDITIDLCSTNTVKSSAGAGVEKKSAENTLTITSASGSGKLVATGNDYGAGIGGSHGVTAKNITIAGGIIEASGGGAGIGGGSYGGAENIYITGGTVTAHGGRSAAGIGSGTGVSGVSAKNIIISGGNVTVTNSNTSAQVIGACKNSSSQNVVITPGTTGVFYTKSSADGTETKVESQADISSLAGIKYFSCRYVPLVSVTLPSEQIGYTITSSVSNLEYNDEVILTFELEEGYSKTENFRVLINENEISLTNDKYTVNATENLVVTVEGVEDITAPTGEIKIKNNSWKEFWNTITFGLFFKETQDVIITGTDAGSGVDKIYYHISSTALTEEQAKTLNISDWTEYSSLSISDERNYVIYVKITDKAGNYGIISSDGLVVDKTAPTVTGIENGKTYCVGVEVTITDTNLENITLNGNAVTLTDNKCTVAPADGTQTIVATDKAGNSVSYTITVNDGHTDNNKDHKCDVCGAEGIGTHKQAIGKHTCDYCGVKMSDCSGGTATCTDRAICEVCGAAYGEKLAHTYDHEIVSEAYLKSEADCTNAAVYYKSCSCGEKGTEIFTSGTAKGHNHATTWSKDATKHWHECACGDKADVVAHTPKTVNAREATTSEKGYTGDTVCEICGYEIAKGKDIPIIETDNEYHITEGGNQSIEENYDGTITIKADGEISKFVSISVDGKLVDATYYTVKSGSTIVTFTKAYLDTLSVGKHTVRFTYTDGYAETSLTITELKAHPEEDDEDTITSPDTGEVYDEVSKTGDETPIVWLLLLLIGSASALLAMFLRRKYNVNDNIE